MKKKLNKKILISLTSLITSFSIVPAVTLLATGVNSSKNLSTDQNVNDGTSNQADQADTKAITKTARNPYNANLVSKNGPITFWNDTIASLDWFGSQRWSLDLTKVTFTNNGQTITPFKDKFVNWNRTWLNWDIDRTNNILYILSNGSGKGKTQYVVSIDIDSGTPLNYWETEGTIVQATTAYYGISVLSGGKQVAAYMRGATNGFEPQTDIIDVSNPNNHKGVKKTGNIKSMSSNPETDPNVKAGSFNYFFNFIPIANDLNLVATYNFSTKGGSGAAGTDTLKDWMTAEIRFILCDNNMNKIATADQKWQKDILALKPITGVKNSATMPQRDFYTLLDGRVVTVIYDSMIIIDGSNRNNPTFTTYQLEPDKWIESWSLDTNENLFYKVRGTSEIKKLVLDKTGGNNHTNSTYYDLSGSSYQEVKDNASNYTLYNVYGYSGQIMLLNSWYSPYVNEKEYPKEDEIQSKQYGLAVAITTHKNNNDQGDTYGLLNGDKSILKSADFTIEQSILASKLPSEFRKSDLTFLNNGFLTTNQSKNTDGTLMYPPFTKVKIDDDKKELTLALYLDQIPWFVKNNVMPSDIAPIKVEKTFTFSPTIESRFQWKAIETDYDFKNTLPTKVTLNEINNYAPLVSTLNSQNATIDGVSYPKTTYSIKSTDDASGQITIEAKYEYLPWEVTANKNYIKTYIATKTYNIFSSSTTRQFVFAGGSTTTDVSLIPELKEIKEADVLPSDFVNASNKEFEKFINTEDTKGYPLGKMKITAVADDTNGTLKITIDPKDYDSTLAVQTKTFTNLNRKTNYQFKISDVNDSTSFKKSSYLPSEITDDLIYANFIKSSGFDQSDFNITKTANDVNGSLTVVVTLKSTYSDDVLVNTDFKKDGDIWSARKTFEGFMDADTRNTQYKIEFKEDTDASLAEIQKLTANTVLSRLKSNTGLTIGNTTYKTEAQLVELFIKSRGVKIPTNLANATGVTVNLTADDGKGEIKIKLQLTNLEGRDTPITFMETITGFVQGNDVNTGDTISFKTQSRLLVDSPELFENTPSQLKQKMLADKSMINTFLLIEPTGGYKQAIDLDEFEWEINANDNDGIINVIVKFKKSDVINFEEQSALEVSFVYSGFVIE